MSDFEKVGFLADNPLNIISEIQKNNIDAYNLVTELNVFSQKFQYSLSAKRNFPNQILATSMYARSLSTFQGVLLLANKGMVHQTQMLLRCLIEIAFRIKALAIKPEFIDRLKIDDNYRDLDTCQGFIDLKNRYSEKDETYDRAKALRIEIRAENKLLDPNKLKGLSVKEAAKSAEMLDMYNLNYSTYSSDIHCSLKSLYKHFRLDENKMIASIINEPTSDDYDKTIYYSIYIFCIVIDSVCKIFKREPEEITKRMQDKISFI